MQWFGVTPPASVSGPFELLIDRAVEEGAPAPRGLVFFDSGREWRDTMAGFSLAERRACIAVAFDDEALVAAARLSIGGGVLLPPSQLRVSAACRAARGALALPSWTADPQAVSEYCSTIDGLTVGLRPAGLWHAMVGLRGQLELLGALATALDRPAVIGPGPSLSSTGLDWGGIEIAWENLGARPRWAVGGCFLKNTDLDGAETGDIEDRWWPVAHWPSGRVVARWKLDMANTACPWRLENIEGNVLRTEAVSTLTDLEGTTAEIVRIQGVPSSEIEREGSPGAVVAEALAREADRSGHTLWIPGVSQTAAAVIRRWGLDAWVDGPVLPPFQWKRTE